MANLKGWGLKTYVGLTMPVEMYLQGSNYGSVDATMALLGNTFAMAKPHWLLHTVKLHPKLATNIDTNRLESRLSPCQVVQSLTKGT